MPRCAAVTQSNRYDDVRRHRRALLRIAPEIGATSDLMRTTPQNPSIETPMSFLRTKSKEIGESRGDFAMLCFGREAPGSSAAFSDIGE